MPLPLSLKLTRRVRRLLPMIERGVAAGLGSRAINSAIQRATGRGIRRQVLLDIMREIRGIQRANDTLQFVRFDRVPDLTRTPTALTPIRRAISSRVQVGEQLLATGERIDRFVQVTHDVVLTRGEIEDVALGFLEDDPPGDSAQGLTLIEIKLVGQVKRA